MSDKYNNNRNDDINEFFAQFDQPQQSADQSHHSRSGSSTDRGYAAGSAAGMSRASRSSRDNSRRRRSRSERTSSAQNTAYAQGTAASQSGRQRTGGRSQTSGKKFSFLNKGGSGSGKSVRGTESKLSILLKSACLLVLGIIMAAGIYVGIVFTSAPEINTDDIYSMLSQRSVMYDSDGNEIENLYFSDGNRTIVKYDDIPEDMVNAVVSIEDKKFWSHNGFNFIRMVGAIKDSVFGGGQISGTSTVTQQLARNVYLSEIKSQRSLSRKISEAYCTIVLEKNLTKEEIMEAYLNTIYLGFNSYGIQAASQAYFSKDVQDLDTLECAALAALPQSPDTYALIKADYYNTNTSLPVLSTIDSVPYLYNGEISKDRRDAVIRNMADSGYITAEKETECLNDDLKSHMKIGISSSNGLSSYFTDYTVEQLTDDIVSEYGVSRSDAQDMIYSGGLKIYTTMDSSIQAIVEDEFDDDSNYAGIGYAKTNSSGDLLDDNGDILLYDYSHYFNSNDEFTLASDEYEMQSDGSMKILKGKRLNIYETEVNGEADVSIEFKGMYVSENSTFYFIESGALSIPQGYKTVDSDGNAIVSAQFFKDYPDFFVQSGSGYVVSSENYSLKQKTRQPQAAMVIMENETGEIKAMIGGRGTSGKQLFNRATNPRQPGSSIKPIAIYGPALQMSYEYEKDGKTMNLDNSDGSNWGKYITAGSIINDAPLTFNGQTWPKNSYNGYRGQMTFRTALQQSVNVCAVKIYQQIGPDYAASMLKKVGITTVDDEGDSNDLNPAALALGGMTSGISPLELTAAYATFPNGGVYKSPISYTKVLNSKDEVLFEKSSEGEQVYNEGVAWIMTDVLRTVVTEGIGSGAAISSQPVGGKTGTTDNNYDAWFAGFTPQYSAALWMGNDVNIDLTAGSAKSASFWSNIMERVCADLPRGSFKEMPDNVVSVGGEYYTDGTYSKTGRTSTTTESESSTEPSTTEPTTLEPSTITPSTEPVEPSSSREHQ